MSRAEGRTGGRTNSGELIVTASAGLSDILERLSRFAATEEALLLQGETGTGKTLLARWVHDHSRRSSGPFQSLSLAGLDDALAHSDLFGHVAGAFTDARRPREGVFVRAQRGTLLLDEVGKASLPVQRRLLEVLERRVIRPLGSDREIPVDVRLILAANESLDGLVLSGKMLPDFLPRLGLFRVSVPPLRDRREAIPALLRSLIARHAGSFGWRDSTLPEPDPELEAALMGYPWPGNVRELDAVVRRLLADALGEGALRVTLLVGDLAPYDGRVRDRLSRTRSKVAAVRAAIIRNGGNKSRAARELGIARSTLYQVANSPLQPDAGSGERVRPQVRHSDTSSVRTGQASSETDRRT